MVHAAYLAGYLALHVHMSIILLFHSDLIQQVRKVGPVQNEGRV